MTAKSKAEKPRLAFGGPVGALILMPSLPLLTLYLWVSVHEHGGALIWPTAAVLAELPSPSWQALGVIAGWCAFQTVLDVVLPGRAFTGPPQKDGKRRTYRLNGLASLLVSVVAVEALVWTGVISGTATLALMGSLLSTAILVSFAFSVFLYVYGKREPSTEGEELKSALSRTIYAYFMGTGLNPRVGRIDLKMFMESKIGMTSWLVLVLLMGHAEYETTGTASLPMILVVVFQAIYTFDFFYFEEAMLTTWDINHENYGWMLAFAFLVWMPFTFSLQAQYLVYASPELPAWMIAGLIVLNFAGYYIFRSSNLQKHRFRSRPQTKIWGKSPQFIQTARGTKLLVSGWWGIARHANYLGDLMMALAWCLACGVSDIVPFFYFIYFTPLLIDRERRDDQHCARKYGADWEAYRKRVPYRIVPYVY